MTVLLLIGIIVLTSSPIQADVTSGSGYELASGDIVSLPDEVITCNPGNINIRFPNTYLEGLNLGTTVKDVILVVDEDQPFNATSQCTAEKLADEFFFDLRKDAGNCALCVENEMIYILFVFRVTFILTIPEEPIVRTSRYEFDLSCWYDHETLGILGPLTPIHKEHKLIAEDEEGNFDVKMFRTDRYFDRVPLNKTAVVPLPLYVEAKLITADLDDDMVLQATSCYATPTEDPDDEAKMMIIEDNCVVTDVVINGLNEVLVNFENETVLFRFNAFYWSHVGVIESRIYLHCCFEVCDPNLSDDCTNDNCDGRKKRSVSIEKQDQMTATLGPITIKDASRHVEMKEGEPKVKQDASQFQGDLNIGRYTESDHLCDKKRLDCSYDCGLVDSSDEQCVCPPGFGLENDRKTCFQYQPEKKKSVEPYNGDYMLPVSAMIVALFCYVLILTSRLSAK